VKIEASRGSLLRFSLHFDPFCFVFHTEKKSLSPQLIRLATTADRIANSAIYSKGTRGELPRGIRNIIRVVPISSTD